MQVIADVTANGKGNAAVSPWRKEVFFALKILLRVVVRGLENFLKGIRETLANAWVRDGLEVRIAYAENIDDDAIGARVEIRRQNIDLLRCESAAEFF